MATTKVRTALEAQARANVKANGLKLTTKEGKAALVLEMARLVNAQSELQPIEAIDLRKVKPAGTPDMPSDGAGFMSWLADCAKNDRNPTEASNWSLSNASSIFYRLSATQESKIRDQFPGLGF